MGHASDKRVLVVDDEPDVRNFIAACIQDAGFLVETAVDGVDALEKIKANRPDLMTLDMVMPRQSGIRLMHKLRQNEDWAGIPVIVITAHAQDEFGSEDAKRFEAFAAHHRPKYFMEKPITPVSLVKAIGGILDVEIDVDAESAATSIDEREKVKKLLNKTDPDTLKKVLEMLDKK